MILIFRDEFGTITDVQDIRGAGPAQPIYMPVVQLRSNHSESAKPRFPRGTNAIAKLREDKAHQATHRALYLIIFAFSVIIVTAYISGWLRL